MFYSVLDPFVHSETKIFLSAYVAQTQPYYILRFEILDNPHYLHKSKEIKEYEMSWKMHNM